MWKVRKPWSCRDGGQETRTNDNQTTSIAENSYQQAPREAQTSRRSQSENIAHRVAYNVLLYS